MLFRTGLVEFLVLTFFMVLFRLVIVLEIPIFFCLKDVLLEVATQIVGVSLYAHANDFFIHCSASFA